MRVEEGPDLQRWISPQRGNPLSDLLSMQQRFFRLLAQPRNDRNAAEAEDEEGIMRIAHDPGQFRFQQSIQHADNLILIDLGHGGLPRKTPKGRILGEKVRLLRW